MLPIKNLLTPHLVLAFPEQRLAHLSDKIAAADARYCAVLKPFTYRLLGLVKFSEVIASPVTATRIFSDLMRPPPPDHVRSTDSLDTVIESLKKNPLEIEMVNETGAFVGLITPDSFIRALLTNTALPTKLKLQGIPLNSRWNPYPLLLKDEKSVR